MVRKVLLLQMLHCKMARQRSTNHNTVKKPASEYVNPEPSTSQGSPAKCRVCLNSGYIPIFGNSVVDDMSEMFTLICGIKVSQTDSYPKHLCHTCYAYLEGAVQLRKTALKTHNELKKITPIASPLIVNEVNPPFTPGTPSDTNQDTGLEYEDPLEDVMKTENCKEKQYHCEICNLHFNSLSDIYTHRRTPQHQNATYKCPVCNKVLNLFNYKRHMSTHQKTYSHMCEVCGKKFTRKTNFLKHAVIHTSELPYSCELCPYRGRFAECLKLHMRGHTGEKPYQCTECPLRCITKSNLNRHMQTHKKEYKFKCDSCGKGYYSKRNLEEHFKVAHAGIKDFLCDLCEKAFGTRRQMMKHQLKVHKREKLRSGRKPLYLMETETEPESFAYKDITFSG